MSNIDQSEKDRLYRQVKHSLGAPIRKVELPDEVLDTLLEISIENIASKLQNWLIDNRWKSLSGKNITNTDISFALVTRSLDFETEFTYAYSKQVGLQARGPWELKKDFIPIESGKQVYVIPAGREVNQVLWMTPPTTDLALFSNFAGMDYGFGFGGAQSGAGGVGGVAQGGMAGGYYVAPAADVLMAAGDFNLKNRLVRSDLVYKLTAGPDGTRLLHLISTPGSKFTFGSGGTLQGRYSLVNSNVWYYYYETTKDNLADCRKENKDVIKLPNEVPLDRLSYDDLNEPMKVFARRLLVAEAKKTLSRVRGKFSGKLGIEEADLVMDYESLLTEGNEEIKSVYEEIDGLLTRLNSDTMLERSAKESEDLNKSLTFRPLGWKLI